MPIDNWVALHDDSDINQLSRTGKVCNRISIAYDRIEGSFIDTFGAGKDFLELQQKRIELEIMKCQQLHSKDFSTQIFIDLLHDDIDLIRSKQDKGGKVRKMVPWVEHEMGIAIDTKKTTVFEFYNRVNFIIEKNSK